MSFSLFSAFLIISVAGLLIFWWLFRRSDTTQLHTQHYLLSLLKDQSLADEQRKTHEKQLSAVLLKGKQQKTGTFVLVISALLMIPSYVLYLSLGNPQAADYVAPAQPTTQAPQMTMQQAIERLEERLKANPNDLDGQILYARSQASIKNYAKAVSAYRKANELAPNESVILTELAESIAMFNNNRSFLGEPAELLQQAVDLDSTNQKALWLLGMTFYEKKDFAKTNELWSKLNDLITDQNAKAQLQQQLNDVRSKLGSTVVADTLVDTEQVAGLINISITIDELLLPKLNGKTALLYIYSKATEGMPMPIAVVREPLNKQRSWPITVSLSDANNLQAQRKLSGFNQVTIGARVSFSGQAIAQTGDLQSAELNVSVGSNDTFELIIDQVK